MLDCHSSRQAVLGLPRVAFLMRAFRAVPVLVALGVAALAEVSSPSGFQSAGVLTGHLKPLGAHQPPRDDIPVETGFPPAKRFFDEYVSQSRPVIMRGAADGWPARWRWTDPYFREMIGTKEVEM